MSSQSHLDCSPDFHRSGDMNICGVLIHANPSKVANVLAALGELPGVDVHETAPGGRIVTTIEDTGETLALHTLTQIHRLDGIVAASLVYHHFDPAADAGAAA